MKKSELIKDRQQGSKTFGHYWLRFINLDGEYSNELFTKNIVLILKGIAQMEGYTGRGELLKWFKQNRPAIFKSSITDADPNGLMYELIDVLKDFEP